MNNGNDELNFDLSFLAVIYNQKRYVLGMLTSILYQAESFFADWKLQLVIADDASNDGTSEIVDRWITDNRGKFGQIKYVRSDVNRGVCVNITNGIEALEGKYVKMIAGDDLFPVTSIRPVIQELSNADIVMGLPLYFNVDQDADKILRNHYEKETLHIAARSLFESSKSFKVRIDRSCFVHTSSMAYRTKIIKNKDVVQFIRKFKYMEDYAMLYKIAEVNPQIEFKFIPSISTLYRRTDGSIILHAYSGLIQDKKNLAKIILHDKKTPLFVKIVKVEEMIAYSINNRWIHVYGIPDYYLRKFGTYKNMRRAKRMVYELQNDIIKNRNYIESLY